jgi:photosystem I reaction center subunit VIII
MSTTFLPSILVPLVGLVFPGIAMRAFFLYAEKESIDLIYFSIFKNRKIIIVLVYFSLIWISTRIIT